MNSICFLFTCALCCVCLLQLLSCVKSSFVSATSDISSDSSDHSLRLIARANDLFCFQLLRHLEEAELERAQQQHQMLDKEEGAGAGGPGNLFISPLSISSLLVMLMAGAGNETYTQIRNALGFDANLSEADIFSTYSHLLQPYLHLNGTASHEISDDEITKLTYSNAVEHQPDQSMLLLNDNHFNGFWKRRFYKEFTQLKSFTSADGQTSQVPTMHRYFARENFAKFEDGELLELPFYAVSAKNQSPESPSLSMFIFLPNESSGGKGGNARLVSEQFASFGVRERLDELLPWKVDIEVPRFSVASSYQLKGALQEMGVTAVFSQGADFSRFYDEKSQASKSKEMADLRLTDLIHRSRIEVLESGAEADFASSSLSKKEKKSKRPLSQPRRVSINRRFLFMIRDTARALTLFAGVVNKI